MNKLELRTALIADTHRDYGEAEMNRYIAQGESLIRQKLVAYGLEYTFTDADRNTDTAIYVLPTGVVKVRQIFYNGCKLDELDEAGIANLKHIIGLRAYVIRPNSILVASMPDVGTEFQMNYLGIPDALDTDVATNPLLDDCQQLYLEAAAVYVYKRAQDYESSQGALASFSSLITAINTKMKRLLGSPRAAPVYNTAFRSSY